MQGRRCASSSWYTRMALVTTPTCTWTMWLCLGLAWVSLLPQPSHPPALAQLPHRLYPQRPIPSLLLRLLPTRSHQWLLLPTPDRQQLPLPTPDLLCLRLHLPRAPYRLPMCTLPTTSTYRCSTLHATT